MTEESKKSKTTLVDCKDKQLDIIQSNIDLRLLVQQFKEDITVFEANLKEKQGMIDHLLEQVAPRVCATGM